MGCVDEQFWLGLICNYLKGLILVKEIDAQFHDRRVTSQERLSESLPVLFTALTWICCMILGKSLNLSIPLLPAL